MLFFNVVSTFSWNPLLNEYVIGWKLSQTNTFWAVNAFIGDSQMPFTIV